MMSKYLVGIFPNLELANDALREMKHFNVEAYHENIVSKETEDDYSSNGLIEDYNVGKTEDLLIGSGITEFPFTGALAAMHPGNVLFAQELDNNLNSGLIELSPPLRHGESFRELYEKGYTLYSLETPEKNKNTVKKIFRAHGAFSVNEV